jgi:hypothetical protein
VEVGSVLRTVNGMAEVYLEPNLLLFLGDEVDYPPENVEA